MRRPPLGNGNLPPMPPAFLVPPPPSADQIAAQTEAEARQLRHTCLQIAVAASKDRAIGWEELTLTADILAAYVITGVVRSATESVSTDPGPESPYID